MAVDVLRSQKGSGVREDIAFSRESAQAGHESQEADGVSEIAAQGAFVRRGDNQCGYYKSSG